MQENIKTKIKRALLIWLLVIVASNADAISQENNFQKIEKIIHHKSWYEGCPEVKGLFESAFKEVEKGSYEWERLVEYYSSCLIEEHKEIEVINFLEDALKILPKSYKFLSGIGTAYMRLKDDSNAKRYFMESIAIKPNHDAYYKLAFIHYKNGVKITEEQEKRKNLLEKAEEAIKKAIEIYSTQTHVSPYGITGNLSLLARIYSAQGKTEEAIKIYREIIDMAQKATDWIPERRLFALTEFKFSLGQLLYRNNKQDEGLKLMNEAIEIAPTEHLNKIKKMLLELMVNPLKSEEELRKRYPQLKEDTFIPLY